MQFNYYKYLRNGISIMLFLLAGCTHRYNTTIFSYDIGFYFQKEATFRVRCIIPKENWEPIPKSQGLWKTEVRHFYVDTTESDNISKQKINCNFKFEINQGNVFFIQNIGQNKIDKKDSVQPLVVITNTPEPLFIDKVFQGFSPFEKLSKENIQIGNKTPHLFEVKGRYKGKKWQPVIYRQVLASKTSHNCNKAFI